MNNWNPNNCIHARTHFARRTLMALGGAAWLLVACDGPLPGAPDESSAVDPLPAAAANPSQAALVAAEESRAEAAPDTSSDPTTSNVSTQALKECNTGFFGRDCKTGTVPANRTLNRVWLGVEGASGRVFTRWKVRDMDTNVVVGEGNVSPNEHFRTGIYGLVGDRYRLELSGPQFAYGFICDC
jgi:hypothetical protein